MSEARLNVRVDNTTKKQAEEVFAALGMNMSTAVNIFLTQVARRRAIPFALELEGNPLERRMQEAVELEVATAKSLGLPIALYNDEQKRSHLEYPDGKRAYNLK